MTVINRLGRYRHIAPLVVFRIAFGAVLFISTIRFILKGWIYDFYIAPKFHFPFFGFEWLHPMNATGMYALYGIMATAALCICLGLFYRTATLTFFLCFCYAELLDKTYYLNHYYVVSILSLLLVFVPANRYFSLDVLRKPSLRVTQVPSWTILVFKYQLCIIYFCAGLSKLTVDWLIHAMPLKIWLLAKSDLPILGPILKQEWAAYFFSWGGALFDLCIPFLLLNRRTRVIGYFLVIIFHALTLVLFQIGVFPYIMLSATLIFFTENFHRKIINFMRRTGKRPYGMPLAERAFVIRPAVQKRILFFLCIYFLVQLVMPFRFLLYPGKLLWTEEGYRFSWRVMLMEKSGASFFYVRNPQTGRKFEVDNAAFLTPYQERMMETQPDMMLQYAHILKREYQKQGIVNPVVTVESYVSLNGQGSQLYIDSTINLAEEKETWFGHKTWILPINK
jgi:hypothetical protein